MSRESNCTAVDGVIIVPMRLAYLESVNQGLKPTKWKILRPRFAPNAPEQNPIEKYLVARKTVGESVTIFAKTLVLSSFYLSSSLIFKPLTSQASYLWLFLTTHLGLHRAVLMW